MLSGAEATTTETEPDLTGLLGNVLVISPHLDDATFSCGGLIAACPGTAVVTVLAGIPADTSRRTQWDAMAGFTSAGEAMTARRAEDQAAMKELQATAEWLDFCDSQYGPSPEASAVAAALEKLVIELQPTTILMPFGMFHPDHLLTYEAALLLRAQHSNLNWLAYEEAGYRRVPGLLQQRLAALLNAGIHATPTVHRPGDRQWAQKQRAVQRYASQLRALASPGLLGGDDATEPERYWQLTAPTAVGLVGR